MPAYDDGIARCYLGDVRTALGVLPDESAHCVVTSPPYWGLRDYGTGTWSGGLEDCEHRGYGSAGDASTLEGGLAFGNHRQPQRDICGRCGAERVDAQLGLERTPEEYEEAMVAVFREVRRVLRRDGTCWVNIGDCYATPVNGQSVTEKRRRIERRKRNGGPGPADDRAFRDKPFSTVVSGLKPKDLVGIPWMLAFALRADGWYLRSDVIWSKPNPMPESVLDRPTKAHEYLFLLTKSERYFYDAEAVREPATFSAPNRAQHSPHGQGYTRRSEAAATVSDQRGRGLKNGDTALAAVGSGARRIAGLNSSWDTGEADRPLVRNKRSVWTIPTQPYPDAHFATFPERLVEPCILAGTSQLGCCAECGAPWRREVAVEYDAKGRTTNGPRGMPMRDVPHGRAGYAVRLEKSVITEGWKRGCEHDADAIPCTVLDPFAGSGTTLAVAKRLNRNAVGVELNPAYLPLIAKRCKAEGAQIAMPA